MLKFILRSKFLSDVLIDGELVFKDYCEYMYDTKEFSEFDDIEEYREYIIDNLAEFKYDIIDFMEQNYFIEDLIKEDDGDGIFTSLGVNKKMYKDTITEILIRYEVIV